MIVTLSLNREEVQRILEGVVAKEASKHGHFVDLRQSVVVSLDGHPLPLKDLDLSLQAQIEVK